MSKDVFVFAEQRNGKVQNVSFELIGEGKKLAQILGSKVVCLLLGNNVSKCADELIYAGADSVIVVDNPMLEEYVTNPYKKAVAKIVKERQPEIFLIGATTIGRDLAPRVSANLITGLTADCTKLEIDEETKELLMTRPAFGGNIMATIVCPNHRPQMATVRPGVMTKLPQDTSLKGEIEQYNYDFDPSDMNIKILEVKAKESKLKDITEEEVLISGGRGVGSKENFAELEELATRLKGSVSGSRTAIDNGWLDKDRQVGQTGKTVKPSVYFAVGISGAIQHVVGMEQADFIVAINKNNSEPIFDVCDVGIVGDLNKILPKLNEKLKSL